MAFHAAHILSFEHVNPILFRKFYFVFEHPKDFQQLTSLLGLFLYLLKSFLNCVE